MRDISKVIDELIARAQTEEIVKHLNYLRRSFSYKAPEQIQDCWYELSAYVNSYAVPAADEWQRESLRILTNDPNLCTR